MSTMSSMLSFEFFSAVLSGQFMVTHLPTIFQWVSYCSTACIQMCTKVSFWRVWHPVFVLCIHSCVFSAYRVMLVGHLRRKKMQGFEGKMCFCSLCMKYRTQGICHAQEHSIAISFTTFKMSEYMYCTCISQLHVHVHVHVHVCIEYEKLYYDHLLNPCWCQCQLFFCLEFQWKLLSAVFRFHCLNLHSISL